MVGGTRIGKAAQKRVDKLGMQNAEQSCRVSNTSFQGIA